MICNKTEQGRHQAGADISRSHLDTDDSLGFIGTEMCRGGMDDTRIDGCTS